ncbi:DUF5723 family protein [Capnocytophaga sp.]|uniref:DUF5723 family protein n=1 Tax=Capnocytophaga sp. TaxID=44737 RepID=UPI0026DACF5D|nr:DUF5723 family protein [Capnocytophaga sp.]MDO5105090.1 DUF5723 family protein [Capnocytophaga sp.]
MMKKVLLFGAALFSLAATAQQSFSGVNTSQFGGMYKGTVNPANFVDGITRFGFNVVSVDGSFGNNKMGLGFDLQKSFDKFTANIQGNNDIRANLGADILGPSAYFHVGRRNAFAVTTRARVLGRIHDMDAKLVQSFLSSVSNLNENGGYQLTIDKQSVTMNAFSEIAFTWSRLIAKDDHQAFKAGITMKIVRGSASMHAGFTDINGTISGKLQEKNGDKYLDITVDGGENAKFIVGNGGVDLSKNPSAGDLFKAQTTGVGFDLGFVYEYRQEGCPSCTFTPYDFKVGASFTDIGRLKYTATDQSREYTLNQGTHQIKLSDIQQSITTGFVTETSLKGQTVRSSLPTAFRLNADVRLTGPLYVDVSTNINLTNSSKEYNASYANSLVVTPRAEWKYFGVYLPISTTRDAGFNMGTALRLGPLFIGSRSIIGNLISKEAKELNVFCGLQFEI